MAREDNRYNIPERGVGIHKLKHSMRGRDRVEISQTENTIRPSSISYSQLIQYNQYKGRKVYMKRMKDRAIETQSKEIRAESNKKRSNEIHKIARMI